MLKVGGRIIYSTCSMNPIENEAVVAEIIKRAEGAIRLVDVSNDLLELKRNPGIIKWMMKDRDGSIYSSFEEVPEEKKKYIVESMFPSKNIQSFAMDKCLRVYPHLQNTGGFFVAVLEKTNELPKRVVTVAPEPKDDGDKVALEESGEAIQEENSHKRLKVGNEKQTHVAWTSREEKPFVFLNSEHELVVNARYVLRLNIRKVYGLEKGFPLDQFVVRNDDNNNKSIYFVGESVKKILLARNSRKLKVILEYSNLTDC